MKKPLQIASKVLLALAIVMFGVSVLLPAILQEESELAFSALLLLNGTTIICAITGSILIYANGDTAKKAGHGLTIGGFVIMLFNALSCLIDKQEITRAAAPETTVVTSTISIASVFMLVAAVLLTAYYVLLFVQTLLNKGAAENMSPADDTRIVRVKEWKQLLDEGIITSEEFEEKRVQILGLKSKQTK